jgi:serpin B
MEIKDYEKEYGRITRELLNRLNSGNKGKNIIISPMSVIMLLGILAESVGSDTREEVIKVLGDKISFEDIRDILSKIHEDSNRSDSLMSSNAVCVKEEFKDSVLTDYKERLAKVYDGKVFATVDMARDVNEWVEEKTRGMIKNAVGDSLDDVVACLMNAVAFEAEWEDLYEEKDIYEEEFHNEDGSMVNVDMLHSSEYGWIEDKDFTGFIKPYKDEKYAFMAILPDEGKNMDEIIERIDFSELFKNAEDEKVTVTMPEYKYDFGTDLTDICKELGISKVFTPAADFSPMSTEWLRLDSIIHKAHIEVDRHGTRAAAVTMGMVMCGCAPMMKQRIVILDRPFIYAIMDTETKLPIFVGIYKKV